MKNELKYLRHGWLFIRNRTPKEVRKGITSEERHEKEMKFFGSRPWSDIPKRRLGARALQKFLSELLYKHTLKELPNIISEIKSVKSTAEKALQTLGEGRESLK